MTVIEHARRYPIGAETTHEGTHFRVWAPIRSRVEVLVEGGPVVELEPERGGYFAGFAPEVRDGTRYRFRLDGGPALYPDPASRFQPDGPHGPSQAVAPTAFEWTDDDWPGLPAEGQILYEMHVGTFTPEGTWAAAAAKLPELRALGVTAIEMMPVADFPGRFGWGYDGTCLFAPTRLYGSPDDLRRFVNAAHGLGLGVILDVVFNHFGPDGNYIREFAPQFLNTRHTTEWGEPFNFDGVDAGPVREFFLANAAYWVEEFHFDGLRLDATQAIYDESSDHILAAIARRVREAGGGRLTYMMGENEPQDANLVRPTERGGYARRGLERRLHHTARVALTGKNEGYFATTWATRGSGSARRSGVCTRASRQLPPQRRGKPTFDIPRIPVFVGFMENHDQVANSAAGCASTR